jgi:XTP/dITP diphosphohydrolase
VGAEREKHEDYENQPARTAESVQPAQPLEPTQPPEPIQPAQPTHTVLIASNNQGKVSEIVESLDLEGWRFLSLSDANVTELPEETGETYEENARIKALAAHRQAPHSAALADDSGLEVDALIGAPGVRSARYSGEGATDAQNTAKLLAALEAVPAEQRTARFVCSLVYVDEQGHEIVARGVCEGRIAREPRGDGGFGYDPVFLPSEIDDGRTMAELSAAEKNRISHRGKALRALRAKLASHRKTSATLADEGDAPTRVIAFDLDGTLLEGHSPVRMVRNLVARRIIPYTTAAKVLWWGVRYRLRLPVEQEQVREYVFRSFSHFPAAEADDIMVTFYKDDLQRRLRPKALETIREHQAAGDVIVLVSASFTPLVREVSRDVHADWFICTQMEIEDGYYTGNVEGVPPEGAQKLVQLTAWADEHFGEGAWVLGAAYGDHRSDEPLLAPARQPVAVNPDTDLERVARRRGWQIVDWSFEPH